MDTLALLCHHPTISRELWRAFETTLKEAHVSPESRSTVIVRLVFVGVPAVLCLLEEAKATGSLASLANGVRVCTRGAEPFKLPP